MNREELREKMRSAYNRVRSPNGSQWDAMDAALKAIEDAGFDIVPIEPNMDAADALRQFLEQTQWKPIDSAPKDEDLLTEITRVYQTLLERLKLKYAGDCKCGNCRLVPADIIMNAANIISYSLPRNIEEPRSGDDETATSTESA